MAATGDADKALFFTMMGGCLLALAIGPFYWAYYNYGHWTNSSAYVETLRGESLQYLTPNETKDHESRITSTISEAGRYRLEMLLSAAGGSILAGFALLLFKKARAERSRRIEYADIDPRTIPRPEGTITVHTTRIQWVMLAGLTIFFGFMSVTGYIQTLKSVYMSSGQIIAFRTVSIVLILFPFVIFLLIMRARRFGVKTMDAAGVTRGDGRVLGWSEFLGVVTKTGRNRYGGNHIWRLELVFRNGQAAWIMPARTKNLDEVFRFAELLPPAVARD